MRALVLGGSRFIGRRLVEALVAAGHQVAVLNRGLTETSLPPEVERLLADRRDAKAFAAAIASRTWDAVFDISGYAPADIEPVLTAYQRSPFGRLVFTSSVTVYKDSEFVPVDEDFPLLDAGEGKPYPANKVACERMIEEARARVGLPYTIIRPSYVYGPHNAWIDREPTFFARLRKGRDILVPGSSRAQLQCGHVDDLAHAYIRAAMTERSIGRAYNITGPHAVTIDGYIQELARIVGVEVQVVSMPTEEADLLERHVYPYRWNHTVCYSIERAKQEIGWAPKYDFVEGHLQTYEWLLSQPGLLDSIPFDEAYEDSLLDRFRRPRRSA